MMTNGIYGVVFGGAVALGISLIALFLPELQTVAPVALSALGLAVGYAERRNV